MKSFYIPLLGLLVMGLASCTDKSKETPEPQYIKREQTTSTNQGQPVQIPMHGTKENSSSGLTSFKMKEDMKETGNEKNTTQEEGLTQ
ncbi:hypothetical protein [Myroides sp. DW712]|uniref:hypothetical protein n=1 Tax=Myroides sp. DW712 TaxID=3389800 RepID=UPI00397D06B5